MELGRGAPRPTPGRPARRAARPPRRPWPRAPAPAPRTGGRHRPGGRVHAGRGRAGPAADADRRRGPRDAGVVVRRGRRAARGGSALARRGDADRRRPARRFGARRAARARHQPRPPGRSGQPRSCSRSSRSRRRAVWSSSTTTLPSSTSPTRPRRWPSAATASRCSWRSWCGPDGDAVVDPGHAVGPRGALRVALRPPRRAGRCSARGERRRHDRPYRPPRPARGVSGVAAEELDRAVTSLMDGHVLEVDHGDGRAVRFRHELVRLVAYELEPPSGRQQFHAIAARALAGGDVADGADWSVIAGHHRRSGELESAASALQRAADDARQRGSLEEARPHFDRAIEWLAEATDGIGGISSRSGCGWPGPSSPSPPRGSAPSTPPSTSCAASSCASTTRRAPSSTRRSSRPGGTGSTARTSTGRGTTSTALRPLSMGNRLHMLPTNEAGFGMIELYRGNYPEAARGSATPWRGSPTWASTTRRCRTRGRWRPTRSPPCTPSTGWPGRGSATSADRPTSTTPHGADAPSSRSRWVRSPMRTCS